ncbi:MAG: glycosyltransferase family 4 protein [Armatimonadota bacterium]|nr:glycosyltransferase family 4 protein [Armatimonadota bacterium]
MVEAVQEAPNHRSICFFARVTDPAILERVEFYAQDIRALRELGFDLKIVTRIRDLRVADFYFIWWWTWAFIPVALARLLRRPCLITGTMDVADVPDRPALHRWLMAFSTKFADANVFVSQLEYRTSRDHLPVNNPCYSPHTVDVNYYKPGLAQREDFILTVAWMHGPNAERKCIPEVLRAASLVHEIHPSVRFVIAGECGSAYPALAQLVDELDANSYIEFPGIVSLDAKIDLMQRCAIYLQPTRYEGFGVAILEAMSCGASVITSPAGAVPEVVGDTAMLVDGASPAEIAAAINHLLNNAAVRDTLGRCARERAVKEFQYDRRKQDLKGIINGIL